MADKIMIKTPRGQVIRTKTESGEFVATLEWNPNFGPSMTKGFNAAQKYVDSEVMRRMAPYMPLRTGAMIKSVQLGTYIGSGEVNVIAPYARVQNDTAPTRPYDAQRGGKFFDRMKADHKDDILRGAQKIAGDR